MLRGKGELREEEEEEEEGSQAMVHLL